jgi:hypothetical protein
LAVVILFQKIPFSYYAGNRFSRKKSCGLIPFVNPFPAEKNQKNVDVGSAASGESNYVKPYSHKTNFSVDNQSQLGFSFFRGGPLNVAVNELSTRKNGKEKKKEICLFLFDQQTAEGQLRFIDESHALPTF